MVAIPLFYFSLCSDKRSLRFSVCRLRLAHLFVLWGIYMDIYRVSFFGHRTIYDIRTLEDMLIPLIKDILRQKEFVEFYVGRHGDYDICVASAVKRAQAAWGHDNSVLILVLPYKVKNIEDYKKYYDDVILPIEEKTHFKAAITMRNRWMIKNSDLVIGYIQTSSGGAYQAITYARDHGIETINLGKET